ncbi:MAG: lysophospholipid acyltransferase family protein [Myxococcales bacterium]
MRSILAMTFAALWTFVLLVPVGLSVLLTWSGDAAGWMARCLWAPAVLRVSGVTLRAEPNPALDPEAPYIFVGNHQGYFDIPAAFATIRHPIRFVAKRSLGWVPILGWYLHLTGHVLIERSGRARAVDSLRRAGEKVARGTSLLVYPEGTRSEDDTGAVRAFKKGAFMLALTSQVPIVPVAVDGSHRIKHKREFSIRPGTLRIKIGEPIPTAGLTIADRDRLMRTVHDRLIDLHLAIGGAGGDRGTVVAGSEGGSS